LSIDYSVIGNRIKKAREDKGVTQETLAEFMDVSNAYISKIERGRTPINLDNLGKICVVLETTPDYILRGTNTTTDDYMRHGIIDMLEGCSPEKIKLIVQVIKPILAYKE